VFEALQDGHKKTPHEAGRKEYGRRSGLAEAELEIHLWRGFDGF